MIRMKPATEKLKMHIPTPIKSFFRSSAAVALWSIVSNRLKPFIENNRVKIMELAELPSLKDMEQKRRDNLPWLFVRWTAAVFCFFIWFHWASFSAMLNSWKMHGKNRMTWTRVIDAVSHPAAVYIFHRWFDVPNGMRADWTAFNGMMVDLLLRTQ